jgi:hypothetical protein
MWHPCNLQLRQLMNVTQVNRIISKFSVHIYWFSVPSTHVTHNAYLLIFSHKHPCIPQCIFIDFSAKHPCIPRCIFIDFKCRALMYPMVYIYRFSVPSTHVSHGIYLLVFSAEHWCIPRCIFIDFQCQAPMYLRMHIYWFFPGCISTDFSQDAYLLIFPRVHIYCFSDTSTCSPDLKQIMLVHQTSSKLMLVHQISNNDFSVYEKKVYPVMVNNSTNINKTNDHLSMFLHRKTWTKTRPILKCYRHNFELLPIFYDLHGHWSITDLILNFYLYSMIYMDIWALQT